MVFRSLIVVLSAALVLGGASCSKDTPAKPEQPAAQQPSKASGGHAPTDVKPGSYEDWCGEHAVPESQCTRCNPELTPAFKATGDWCEEHGLPESQCLKCNPGLKIVRPPKAGG
jgi:hypothetical protein